MTISRSSNKIIPVDILLSGYEHGIFPMGDEHDTVAWYEANPRSVIDLVKEIIPPRSFRQFLQKNNFEIRVNTSFSDVIRACSVPRHEGDGLWISPTIIASYEALYREGYAHSVETWSAGELVGGLYGVAMGGTFFGESMFHSAPNASKFALWYLIHHLREKKFTLLDTQMMTPTVKQFGAVEISREEYQAVLRKALERKCVF